MSSSREPSARAGGSAGSRLISRGGRPQPPVQPSQVIALARTASSALSSRQASSPARRRTSSPVSESSSPRSEEHTSELQSRGHLVCRLLLEKKTHHQNDNS